MTAVFLEASNTPEKQVKADILSKMCKKPAHMAVMHARFGGTRMIDMRVGDPLSRIC